MANKILSDSFKVFTKYGYAGDMENFQKLIKVNPDALNDAYEQYKNDIGFEGTIEEYAAALNQKPATVKKKEQEPSGMELPSEDGSSEQSTPQQPEPPKKPRTYGTLNLPGIAGALRTGKPSAKELAAIGEFAKKTEVKKEKPITAEEFDGEEPKRPKLVDPTLAAIPQRDVLRESPALKSKEQIQKKVAEATEDAKATEQYKDKQKVLTTLQFARDKEKEFEQRKEREQESAELIANADFNKDIEDAAISIADKGAEQVASDLSKTMGKYGFSFTGVKTMLYPAIVVTGKRVGGETPTLELVLTDKDAQQKLKSFMQQYASKPYQFTPTDNQIDAEGQEFYASRGLDYKNERERQQRYYDVRDERMAAESIDPDDPTTYNETMRQKFPNLFLSSGAPRRDMSQVASDLLAEEDRLYATVFDKGVSRDAREQWDVELEKKRKEAAATAAIKNNVAKNVIKDVNTYLVENLPGLAEIPSTGLYTQPIEKLMKYKPKTEAEADIANEAIRRYTEAAKISKEAADQYQLSQLYFDEKINKSVQGEYVENIEGIYKSIHDAWKEGKTGVTLQKIRDGLYDRLDSTDVQEAAKEIVDAQIAKYNQQSAVMGRADAAVSTREYLDAILEDPFEYATTLVTSSLTQALPNFIYAAMKVVPATAAGGAVIPGVGAAAGVGFGLKRAQELASLSMEFTSAFTEAMKDNNLDILNPNDVATAIQSDAIWEEAKEVGFKRGIPIALMDYVGGRVAGRLFKVSDYASQAAKTGAQVAERFVVDPILEGSGEALAQLVSSGDIDWKEVSAEAIGGVGGNVTGMAANIYMDTQGKANIEIADNLTNIDYVANETASDERISNWANNMHRLGKIDADVNQRIQENIGHKRSAENLLDVGADKRERKDKSPLVARMMKLLAAEKELSSTEERRKVFSDKLSAIRKEQAYIADKQQLAPDDAKVDVDAIIKEQPQPGNYSYNGRRMTKAQFTERIEKMSPQKLANAVARKRLLVTGDPEVVKTINDKLNAVQKPTTKEGVLRQEGPEVELREMGERDAEGQAPQAPITYTQEEVTKRKDELTTKLEQLTKEAEAAPDDTELAGRVAEVKQQVAGMEAIGRRLETQENVKQSIKSVYPDLEVVEVNNAKEMEDYVAANVEEKTRKQMIGGEGGVIIFGADGKPESIIINNEVADSTTMPHEAWHGILFKAFGDNPELFAEFRASIDKALRDNGFGDIADRLDQFVAEGEYAPELMAEEWLVELGGLLVSQGIDVKNLKPNEATLLQQIKDIINAFAERIIGQPVFLKDATPENILDFMVTISERMRKGESIADFFGEEGNVTKASTDIKASRKVFHGSPYDFERFDMSKIGTGEGAQAFGWGLYFTDLEDIARGYAEKLTGIKAPSQIFRIALGQAIDAAGGKNNFDKRKALEFVKNNNWSNRIKDWVIETIEKNNIDKIRAIVYEVTLHEGKTPDQYTWLDWDKPIDKQIADKLEGVIQFLYPRTEAVQNFENSIFENLFKENAMPVFSVVSRNELYDYFKKLGLDDTKALEASEHRLNKTKDEYFLYNLQNFEDSSSNKKELEKYRDIGIEKSRVKKELPPMKKNLYEDLKKEAISIAKKTLPEELKEYKTGEEIYREIESLNALNEGWRIDENVSQKTRSNWAKQASLFLLENGIDGIKYPAESIARGATSETARGFNYVVFDDKAVTIEKKVKFSRKNPSLQTVEATAKALEGAAENNPSEFIKRPDGKVELVGGIIKPQTAALKGDKKDNVTTPSKIPFLPSKITLTHLAESKADKNGILKDGFDIKRVNIDSPIPGIYFSSEDWSTMGRFGRSKENALFVEIENDGLLYFDSSSDFREYLKENKLPYQGETLSKEQLEFLKGKGIKGILLREDFASQSKNELIIIDDSIIKDITESEKPTTKLPSSFSEPQSIAEAYHAAKKDGSNPELVNAVEELLGGEEKKVKFSRKVTKEEVSDVFKSHPKLSKIGTPEQYSRYLDTIFPDTKQGGVFYHKTMASRAPKDGKFKGYVTYFSSDKDYKPMGLVAEVTIPVVLNIQNPLYAENEMFDAPEEVHRKGEYTAPRVVKSDNLGYDSVIGKDAGQEKGYSIAVFEPEQIHQIGTPKDESAFRRFVIADKVKSVGRFVSGLFTEEKEKKAKFSRKKQDQKPPSVAKLLGITDKKVEIKEKTALANQLKAEARGARNAVKAWKDRAKLLADELKQLKGSNKINQSQYIAALRALVKVNIFNEDSISKFVDYVTKVINNAEYAKQIADLRKALPVAKKNVDRKLGWQPNLQQTLKRIFAVSPSMIPDDVFERYVKLVNMIGERARVLNLDEESNIMADATAIANMIDHEQFLAQMLKDAFDNYREKVRDENGDVDYQKTIEKMVSDGIIQPSDIELMKKYKGVIVPRQPKTEAEIQAEAAEREQERQDFVSSISLSTSFIESLGGINAFIKNLVSADEKAGAKELIELSKDAQVLERMTLEQLRNLDKVLDNIANGFYPAYAHTLKEVMNGIKSSEGVRKAMPKIKIPAIRSMVGKLKAALMKGENMYYHVLSKVPLYIIDQQLGNYKTSPIYKNIFEKVAIAQSKLASKQKQLLSQLDKAADAVFKEARRAPDKARMSEYRIFTYLLHREFMSNPGAKGVADAVNFIKATIEYHEENGDTAQVNSRDVDMLQKILDEYESNGKLDFAKLERSLTPKERAYVDALDKVNNEVYSMAEYTASVLRGESVPMLNNYVHHRVLPSKKAVGEQPNELMKANQRMNPSSRSGSLISREPGVKPLNFKVFSTQKAAVNSVLVDRFMTEPIRTTRRMFESLKRSLKDDGMLRGHNRDIVAALEMAFEKANEALLTNNLMYDTFMDEVISSVTRDAYRALLARPTRAIVEYASNLSAALTKSTGAFIDGMSMKGAMSQEELGAFMYSVNSAQVSRVMPSSDMSSKFIDFGATGPAIGRQGSTANSSLANRMLTIYNRTLRRYKGGVDSVADALISTPDKAVSQPVWTGSFYNQFKKITGVNPDKDKIISGDEAYMERYKDAIKSATEKADEEVFMLSSVDNPYMGILNTLKSANDSPMRKAYKMFNNFLTRFQINDYVNARAAVNAMVNNGKMSKADGARLLVAITLRSVVYIALGKIAIEAMLSAIVDRDPEEEDDRSYMEIASNALASSMTTLMFGRSHGNLLRGIIGMGVEEINEEHLGFMRRGAYDPSRDAIQFGLIPKYSMDDKQGFGLWDVIKSMSGPFGPMVNTIDNALKASTKDLKEPDAIRRAEQTLMIRTPFELLGNRGWIPAYGDIRKIIVADINKGIGIEKKKPKQWEDYSQKQKARLPYKKRIRLSESYETRKAREKRRKLR